ncbi:MAG: hypothetical protein CL843_00020 [Crocinitomicaceae bacterium]|nr:hypothetical protein [Crocinitomicaceae bacterium]|tara:strand:- start:260 stop:673 length:414 start_codon:yes stop_codon:yes gene_type:complete
MEQRDRLKDEIEQLGKVLAKILSDFLHLKSTGQISQSIKISNQQLESELDIDIHQLLALPHKELTTYLQDRQLTTDHIETLAEYLKELGKSEMDTHKENATLKLKKAMELLDIADEISKTISFDRMHKKNTIAALLN